MQKFITTTVAFICFALFAHNAAAGTESNCLTFDKGVTYCQSVGAVATNAQKSQVLRNGYMRIAGSCVAGCQSDYNRCVSSGAHKQDCWKEHERCMDRCGR